jgi:hypothetical protein
LEGLIVRQNDEDYENLIDKRKLLLRDKTNYFKQFNEFRVLTKTDLTFIEKNIPKVKYSQVLSDVSEFWKYLMSDGVIYFLI